MQYVVRPQTAELAPWAARTPDRSTATTAATPARSSPAGSGSATRSSSCPAARTPPSRRYRHPGRTAGSRGRRPVGGAPAGSRHRRVARRHPGRDRRPAGARPRGRPPRCAGSPTGSSPVGARVLVQHGTSLTKAHRSVRSRPSWTSVGDGEHPVWVDSDRLALNDIGRIRLALATPAADRRLPRAPGTGAFIIVDEADGWTLGAGMAGPTAFTVEHRRTPDESPTSMTSTPPTPQDRHHDRSLAHPARLRQPRPTGRSGQPRHPRRPAGHPSRARRAHRVRRRRPAERSAGGGQARQAGRRGGRGRTAAAVRRVPRPCGVPGPGRSDRGHDLGSAR